MTFLDLIEFYDEQERRFCCEVKPVWISKPGANEVDHMERLLNEQVVGRKYIYKYKKNFSMELKGNLSLTYCVLVFDRNILLLPPHYKKYPFLEKLDDLLQFGSDVAVYRLKRKNM